MARIPQRFIDDLLDRADIVDVVGSRIDLRKSGKNYSARCPFHDEKTPSFTVSPDKQFYYCFGCGAGGNAIGFIMDFDRIEFPRAVEQLASHCGLQVPREADESPVRDDRRKSLYSLLQETDRFYRDQLRRHPDARLAVDYLKNRGLSGDIARIFGIGFAPPGWDNLITELGTNDDRVNQLIEAGLVVRKEDDRTRVYDRFRHRIMFPIRDTRGRTIGFGGRVLDDSKPKYLNSPETPVFHKGRELYGLYEAHKTLREIPNLVVVEGYMDVVALAQYGIHNAVATLGTAATDEHLEKLFRYTPEVIFCFDGDDAGRRAARRALETCLPVMTDGRSARFLFLPEGEDPDTLVRRLGADGFRQRLAEAQPLSDYLFAALGEGIDTTSLDGKARLSNLAAPLINRIPAGVYRQLMLKSLARRTDMDVDELSAIITPPPSDSEEADDHTPSYPPPDYDLPDDDNFGYPDDPGYGVTPEDAGHPVHRDPGNNARRLKMSAIQRLVLLVLHNPALVSEVDKLDGIDRLDDPDAQLLANLLTLLKDKPDYTLNHILGYWRGIHGADQGELLARIVASDLMQSSAHSERDNLKECLDICGHLQKRIDRNRPAREQLEELLARQVLSAEDRKQLFDLWHNHLPASERTEELNFKMKQALARRPV